MSGETIADSSNSRNDFGLDRMGRRDLVSMIETLDREGYTQDDRLLDVKATKALWVKARRAESAAWLDMAWTLYRLRQKIQAEVVSFGGEIKNLQVERWMLWASDVARETGDFPRYRWEDFCRDHLGLSPSDASTLRRIWEVYSVTLGKSRSSLLRAGKSKLRVALTTVAKDWETRGYQDPVLDDLLFGDDATEEAEHDGDGFEDDGPEVHSGAIVDVESEPGIVTTDEDDSEGAVIPEPAAYREIESYIQTRREEDKGLGIEHTAYDFSIGGNDGDVKRPIIVWVRRPGAPRAIPFTCGEVVIYGESCSNDGELMIGDERAEAVAYLLEAIARAKGESR